MTPPRATDVTRLALAVKAPARPRRALPELARPPFDYARLCVWPVSL